MINAHNPFMFDMQKYSSHRGVFYVGWGYLEPLNKDTYKLEPKMIFKKSGGTVGGGRVWSDIKYHR